MIDHDKLEDFRDGSLSALQNEGNDDGSPLTEQWARAAGGPCWIWHAERDIWPCT